MRDLDDAMRGLTATLAEPLVKSADGKQVCDTGRSSFMTGEAPATVGPSLWRMERLNSAAVLLRVTESTDQICGHDLANVNLVECKAGRIVIDPLLTARSANATLTFALEQLGSKKPGGSAIYTRSRADHFGGARGVIKAADGAARKVEVSRSQDLPLIPSLFLSSPDPVQPHHWSKHHARTSVAHQLPQLWHPG